MQTTIAMGTLWATIIMELSFASCIYQEKIVCVYTYACICVHYMSLIY